MHQQLLEPSEEALPSGQGCRLEVAALFERRTHTAGIGWRLTVGGQPGPVHALPRRRGPTLLACELAAVQRGLNEAVRRRCPVLSVCVSDPRAVSLLRGDHPSRFPRADASAARIRPLLAKFAAVRFESQFRPDPELAHAVGEAFDAGLHAAAEQEKHRVWVMERIMERAKGVSLERRDSTWVANGRYRVQLDPMRCDCPAWTARWSRTPIGGRRAQRLPCKHLVALAMHEGITAPSDLARLARRAPP